MSIAVDEFADRLIGELNECIDKTFQIPDEVLRECGTSVFMVALQSHAEFNNKYEDISGSTFEEFSRIEHEKLDRLYRSVPGVPKEAVNLICMAYSAVSICFDKRSKPPSDEDAMKTLMTASMVMGMAMGMVCADPGTKDAVRTKALSMAGKLGAEIRHGPSSQLKMWARGEAKTMRGSDIDVAKILSAKIPAHLADVSKDPQRLIYDALRAASKNARG